MKITIALGFFNPCPPLRGGGVERMWYQLAGEFADLGNEVTILSRTWPGMPDREQKGNLRHIRLRGFNHRSRLIINLLLDIVWSFRLLWHIPKADILITNSIFFPILSGFFRFCGLTVVNLNRYPKGQLRWYTKVRCIQTPSNAIARAAEEQAPSMASRICVVPNSADLAPFLSISRIQKEGVLTIGYLGRIHPEKGLDTLIQAACELLKETELPEWKLAITGPHKTEEGGGGEDYFRQLQKLAIPLMEQKRIEFLPAVFSRDEIVARYVDMDIFCYPSIAEKGETFGIAILEAMASALPVIVSRLDCFSDLVEENQTGLVFDHTSENPFSALASQLACLLRDSRKRALLGIAAREKARAFDVKEIAFKHLEDFKKLLESPREAIYSE